MKQNNLKLISFDNCNAKQIELKHTDIFKWKYTNKLLTLSKVNNTDYQIIMVKDINEYGIDLYYCKREWIAYSIQEINRYYFCFIQTDYIDIELI